MASVTLGDGRTLTVGDEFLKLSPADQQAWVNDVAKTLPPPKKSIGEVAQGAYSAFDAGVGRAVAGAVSLPRTATDIGAAGIRAASDKISDFFGMPRYEPIHDQGPIKELLNKVMPTYEQAQKAVQDRYYGGAAPYEPQNTFEEYMRTGGEFAAGAAGGGGGLIRRGAQVVLPTITSESAGQATKGTSIEPYARFLGALTGMGVQAFLQPGTTAEVLAKQLPRGITPRHVDAADALMADAAARGVTLTWPEALSQVAGQKVYSDLMRHLEATPTSGRVVEEAIGQRPQQVRQAARGAAEEMSPGVPTDPYTLGPQVKGAATDRINQVRQQINADADRFYYAANPQDAAQEVARLRATMPGWDEAAAAVINNRQLSRHLTLDAAGNVDQNTVGFLNAVKKYAGQQRENATSPLRQQGRSVEEAGGWATDEASARDAALRASRAATPPGQVPPYAEALATESGRRSRELDPLLQGPLGEIADAQPKIKNALNVLFPTKPEAHSQQAIGDAVRNISNVSPKIAQDVVRAHIEKTFNEAGMRLQTGPNPAGGAKFFVRLAGNEQQRANLQAAVEALPNGAERWQGFNRLLDIMEATGTRQNIGSRTAYNVEALKEFAAAGGSAAGTAAKSGARLLDFAKPVIDAFNNYKLGRNLNELAGILTDRRSVNMLRDLAGARPNTVREANLVRGILLANRPPRIEIDTSQFGKPPAETSR